MLEVAIMSDNFIHKEIEDITKCYLKNNSSPFRNHITEKIIEKYQKAVEQENPDAEFLLGVCCSEGIGMALDQEKGKGLILKSAQNGNALAQRTIGYFYASGKGFEKDEKEAIKWYRKSAKQGYGIAQNDLSICYYTGTGL